ncbi:MAG TPA: universal stress protein [Nitrososphaeraceae archaeon]|nr:universal stress protein [Nitrososphaeraceae archaeon]
MGSKQIGNLKSNDKDNLHFYMHISLKEEMMYNKILVQFDDSKPSETTLEHATRIAKMSGISSTNSPVSVILLHVVQQMLVPSTFGFGLFKSSKTGNMVNLEQYLKDITLEIKDCVKTYLKKR